MFRLLMLAVLLIPINVLAITDLKLNSENSVLLEDVVDAGTVDKAMSELDARCRFSFSQGKATTLYLVLNTPGGYIDEGRRLTRFMEASSCTINTVVLFAASMGHIIAQYGKIRYIHYAGKLMQHTPGVGMFGNYTLADLRQLVKELEDVNKELLNPIRHRMLRSLKDLLAYIGDERWWVGKEAVDAYMSDAVCTINGN